MLRKIKESIKRFWELTVLFFTLPPIDELIAEVEEDQVSKKNIAPSALEEITPYLIEPVSGINLLKKSIIEEMFNEFNRDELNFIVRSWDGANQVYLAQSFINAFRSTHTIAQKRTQTENEQLRKVLAEIHGKDEVDTAMSILDYDHLAECRKLYSKYQIVAVDATGIGEHLDTLLSRLDPRTVLIVINAQEWLADEKGNSTQNAMSVLTSNYPKVLIFDPDSNGYSVLHESDIRRKYYRVVHIPQPCT